MHVVRNLIGGTLTDAKSGRTRPVYAPASGQELGAVVVSAAEDVAAAYAAATSAAPAWRSLGVAGRQAALLAWAAEIRARLDEVARVDAIDSGTPIRTMRAGATKGLEYIEYYANLASELHGETIPATPHGLHYTVREPFGVVAVIIPFNHPAYFAMSKTAPALAAGNTVVLKPAEQTPLSAGIIAEAAQKALPPGVFNVVQGDAAVGQALVSQPGVHRIHFTGGVKTGLAVQAGAAASGWIKHVTLELGGKNPLIVFPDADPQKAAHAAVVGMNFTRNQGQSCGSTSRLFVHRSIADEVVKRACELAAEIRLGMPEREDTQMGSLVSREHQQRVLGYVERGRAEGARLRLGGHAGDGEFAAGAFVVPTIFDQVRPDMTIAREEIFGPVLSVLEWTDEDEMFRLVNDTEYGLTAAIYTNDVSTAIRAAARVESGYVWINGVETRWRGVPFGGYKNSGIGAEHSFAELESYTRTKAVNVVMP